MIDTKNYLLSYKDEIKAKKIEINELLRRIRDKLEK